MPTGSGKPKGHDFAAVARRVVEQAIGEGNYALRKGDIRPKF